MASSRIDDPTPPDPSAKMLRGAAQATQGDAKGQGGDTSQEARFLTAVRDAGRISLQYQTQAVSRSLARSYRAWRNEHDESSKYRTSAWRGRSRLFVPKTRSAVRKQMATATAAFFSTDDVVNVEASYGDDEMQRASAAVLKADLNYRLTASNRKSGMPWFLTCIGAVNDANLTGVIISKEYWEYETVEDEAMEMVLEDEEDPASDYVERSVKINRVVKDRPMIDLLPVENVRVDPAAPWYDVAQLGAWFIARYPMHISDLRTMMESDGKNGVEQGWRSDVPDSVLIKGRTDDTSSSTRSVREGSSDRYDEVNASLGDWDIVWIQENFIRIDGIDWHFWSVDHHGLLSDIRKTEDAYPALHGDRPYTFGVGALDPHRVYPMAPVESWQPLQLEMNDIVNLRLDTLKRSIAPLAKVKRGKKVDLKQVQRRGQPDAVLQVDSMEDVEFEATPGPSGQSYTETSSLNSSFDELSGTFSTSSVESNRRLNETVGGMQLLSGSANALSEFDLRVFNETWAERSIRHVVHMIQYHESDETVLAIAGSKARVWQKYGVSPTLDDLLAAELTTKINIGVGSSDPMQKLAKLSAALEMSAPLTEILEKQGISPDGEALIEEIFGAAGFKDGRRFFKFDEEGAQQNQMPPELIEMMEKLKVQMAEIEAGREKVDKDNQTKLAIADMNNRARVGEKLIGVRADMQKQEVQVGSDRTNRMMEMLASRGQEGSAPAKGTSAKDVVASRVDSMAMERQDANARMIEGMVRRLEGIEIDSIASQRRGARMLDILTRRLDAKIESTLSETERLQERNAVALDRVVGRLEDMSSQIGEIGVAVDGLTEHVMAPVSIIRDGKNTPREFRKGNLRVPIRTDDQGRILGTGQGQEQGPKT